MKNNLTYSALVEMLESIKGVAIVGLLAITDARLLKTGNMLAMPVSKLSRVVGFVGANYGAAVNREANRQGGQAEFVSAGLAAWQVWALAGKVIAHKITGKLYLRTQSTPGQYKRQPVRLLAYLDAQGKEVSKEDVEKFLPTRSESAKQQAQTGIERTVRVNDYAFESIRRIRINGKSYNLVAN